MVMVRSIGAACLLLPLALLLNGCGGSDEGPESATAVVADVSGSAERSDLRKQSVSAFQSAVLDMTAPAKVKFLAFNMEVGSSTCPPLVASLPWSGSTTTDNDTKEAIAAQIPGNVASYVDCAKGSVEKGGSDVVGGIVAGQGLVADAPGAKRIVLLTDGCQRYRFKTCTADITDTDWRAQTIESLPESLKPDLTGIDLTIEGLARGTDLQGEEVQGLKDFYKEYAAATGANLTIAE